MRIKIIRLIIILMFLVIVGELFYAQGIRGGRYYNLSQNNSIRVVPLEAPRGRILDRNGEVLADNRHSYNLTITPQAVRDTKKTFQFLSHVLDIDEKSLIKKYQQKKITPFTPVVVYEDILKPKAIVIEENKYRFPSLFIQESFRRIYPKGASSAHVLGYVGKIDESRMRRIKEREYGFSPQSMIGYSGVEEYYDDYLQGEPGGLQIEVNNKGQQVRLLSIKQPKKGDDIMLTIDSQIQQAAMELIQDKIGSVIVMDLENGEILGMVNSPAYDPNWFVNPEDQRKVSALFSQPFSPLLNRAIKGLFPPGSVFKIPVAIAALDTHKITPNTSFTCTGSYDLGGRSFGCTHTHGVQNLIEGIAHSCNVYFYNVGRIIGEERIHHYARLLGLGSLTNIDLPYEEAGFVPSRAKRLLSGGGGWYLGDTLNLSIGQGDTLVTPMQLVRMMATVASDGFEVQPHVIKSINNNPVVASSAGRQLRIDKNVFRTVQRGLRAVVSDEAGTAHDLDLPGVFVAGKTGTAQSSGSQATHAWFVGYAKGRERNIVFCVFLEHGGSSQNASAISRDLLLRLQQSGIL